ncbi:glucarate dehydratase family protein [Streptomyces genisteinicus]|uniref:glucarate dehydratase n=1 Tax=Streptomyces genisteinicus TaxID=2768068 RepID=A0A7H0I4U8_9ACTN|nr:glucarate dehydratase family protein [Streptomyces genisteinicus]QNP67814.1 glucarate dehydratase [Streptomyces genisteinicus]
MSDSITITRIDITPVAFKDPALLNAVGVHEPYALRAVVEVSTDQGLTGLGETYADEGHLRRLRAAADAITGTDVHALGRMRQAVALALGEERGSDGHGLTGMITTSGTLDRVFSPFEVACLDIQARAAGRPVCDLLGGAVRDRVPFSAYLFYKWAGHPGGTPDDWGPALDPEGIVAQARRMVDTYGFTAVKLKGGVMPPRQEVDAVLALREAFPGVPLRLDPNAAWTVETSLTVARELEGVLEYLEDPTPGQEGMARVAREAAMPLATNMCVVGFDELPAAVRRDAVQVVLSDHHYWGGLQRSRLLAGICDTFGMGLSMHSNSHLGISLAAMTHLGAATENLTYACDTHWPWKDPAEDVVAPGALGFRDGSVAVPAGPGLGVELDRDALARLHEQYLACGLRNRDDTGYMRSIDPAYEKLTPRW